MVPSFLGFAVPIPVLLALQSKIKDSGWTKAMISARNHLPSKIEVKSMDGKPLLKKSLTVRFGQICVSCGSRVEQQQWWHCVSIDVGYGKR